MRGEAQGLHTPQAHTRAHSLTGVLHRGVRFIPSTHSLLLVTQAQDWVDPLLEHNNSRVRWWDTHVLSDAERQAVLQSTAINRWRGVPCVPARSVRCLLGCLWCNPQQ